MTDRKLFTKEIVEGFLDGLKFMTTYIIAEDKKSVKVNFGEARFLTFTDRKQFIDFVCGMQTMQSIHGKTVRGK